MNGRRKPRQPRVVGHPMTLLRRAALRASCYTREEIAGMIDPLEACFKALREGVATHDQYLALNTSLMIAQGIEAGGVVRGLREHLATAMTAMQAIEARALASGTWHPTPLHWHELDAIRTAVDLHEFQLGQISAGELQPIVQRLINTTQASGGQVEFASPSRIGVPSHAL